MTLNEIYAKIKKTKEEISFLEAQLNNIPTTSTERTKEYFQSDWEKRKVGGAVINTSNKRYQLTRELEDKKQQLKELERAYKQTEKERYNAKEVAEEEELLDNYQREKAKNERSLAFFAAQRRYKEKSVFERAAKFISGKSPKWDKIKADQSITTEDLKNDNYLRR